MKRTLAIGIIMVLLLACAGVVSAVTVVNGGFEDPAITSDAYNQGSLPGWTVDLNNIDHIWDYWTDHPEGSRSIDLSGSSRSSISQIITTDPSKYYSLSFSMAGNWYDNPITKKLTVYWDAEEYEFTFDTTGSSPSNMQWKTEVITGLKGSGNTVIRFADKTTDGNPACGVALDNIEVTESSNPIPEFPTVALPAALVVGLIGAVLFIRKSKEE